MMRLVRKSYQPRPWYSHRWDCSCNSCFNHKWKQKATGKNRQIFKGDYFEYINSPAWARRKEKYYKTHKRICQACGWPRDIELHHLEYGRFGIEPDYALASLCRACHRELHEKNPTKQNMIKVTLLFIKAKQRLIRKLLDKG